MIQEKPQGRIQGLLEADEANTRMSAGLMAALHPWAVTGFEDTAELFRLLYRRMGDWSAEHDENERLHRMAIDAGLTDQQLAELLKAEQATHVKGAEAAYARLWTLRVVKLIVIMCQRCWAWGASDLFRLRITSAQGYLRLEAESLALIALFLRDDALAGRWLHLKSKAEGLNFFRDTQPRLKEVLRGFHLHNTYDMASGVSQHVRMAGLVRGLTDKRGELKLPDQEIDPDDLYSFHLAVAYFHLVQARVLRAFGSILPGVHDAEWTDLESAYVACAADLWKTLDVKYANEIAEYGNDEDKP